ncbi:MAG: hypothetical protein O2898_09925 [Proteobacteria bacterium]|nr:hypothetical protein [Pseudomonadota bacterium]
MALLNDLADKLAIDVLKVVDKLGDDQLIKDVAKILAASSTPMEEAFLSCARMRQAEQRARAYLREHVVKELGRETG